MLAEATLLHLMESSPLGKKQNHALTYLKQPGIGPSSRNSRYPQG